MLVCSYVLCKYGVYLNYSVVIFSEEKLHDTELLNSINSFIIGKKVPRMHLLIILDCSAEISRLSIFFLHVLFMESRTNISNVCLFNTSKCIRDFSKLHKAPILTLKAQTGHSKKNQQKKLHAVRIELGTSTIPV